MKNNKIFQKTTNVDRNVIILQGILESMLYFNFDNEITNKIKDFLIYLDKKTFFNEVFDIDIISEKCQIITKYKKCD